MFGNGMPLGQLFLESNVANVGAKLSNGGKESATWGGRIQLFVAVEILRLPGHESDMIVFLSRAHL